MKETQTSFFFPVELALAFCFRPSFPGLLFRYAIYLPGVAASSSLLHPQECLFVESSTIFPLLVLKALFSYFYQEKAVSLSLG